MASDQTDAPRKLEAVTGYLDQRDVAYEVVGHNVRYTAAGEARAAGIEPHDAAKDVLLRDDGGYLMMVIPASERLDLAKVRAMLEPGGELRLATEDEIAADFPDYEVGAVPPVGPMEPTPEIVDRRLLDHDRILCSGGDHGHSLLIDPRDIVRLAEAHVGDICQD